MNTLTLSDSIKDYYRLLMASKTEKNVKQKNRYDAVLLYMEGYPRKQIAQILHIPHRTVNYHILNYEKGDIESLLNNKTARSAKVTYSLNSTLNYNEGLKIAGLQKCIVIKIITRACLKCL